MSSSRISDSKPNPASPFELASDSAMNGLLKNALYEKISSYFAAFTDQPLNAPADAQNQLQDLIKILNQGSTTETNPNGKGLSFTQIFGTTGFGEITSPVFNKICDEMVGMFKNTTISLPPKELNGPSQNISFFDLLNSNQPIITTISETLIDDAKNHNGSPTWPYTPMPLCWYSTYKPSGPKEGFCLWNGVDWRSKERGEDSWGDWQGASVGEGICSNYHLSYQISIPPGIAAVGFFNSSGLGAQLRAFFGG